MTSRHLGSTDYFDGSNPVTDKGDKMTSFRMKSPGCKYFSFIVVQVFIPNVSTYIGKQLQHFINFRDKFNKDHIYIYNDKGGMGENMGDLGKKFNASRKKFDPGIAITVDFSLLLAAFEIKNVLKS